MKKKLKISIIFLFPVIAITAGYFIYDYWQYKSEGWGEWQDIRNVEYESAENYKIIETSEGRKVINENAGLSFPVPEGWSVKIIEEENEVEMSSADIIHLKNKLFPDQGCNIGIFVEHSVEDGYEESRLKIVNNKIESDNELIENIQYIISVDGHKALKTVLAYNAGELINVEIPRNNKIYSFVIPVIPSEKERCFNKADIFLENIRII